MASPHFLFRHTRQHFNYFVLNFVILTLRGKINIANDEGNFNFIPSHFGTELED